MDSNDVQCDEPDAREQVFKKCQHKNAITFVSPDRAVEYCPECGGSRATFVLCERGEANDGH